MGTDPFFIHFLKFFTEVHVKKAFLRKILVLLLILGCFCGCGGDDVGDNEGSIVDSDLDDKDQIPTITEDV
ncbi:MAG: hypothetical protein MJE68_01445 [Proteobacteria bacterium]|nr:hypothetical protein [Pseudomonadota bacterium]